MRFAILWNSITRVYYINQSIIVTLVLDHRFNYVSIFIHKYFEGKLQNN